MRTFKIILAILFGLSIYGNLDMMVKGEYKSGYNYFALLIIIIIEVYLVYSISKEKK